MKSKRILVAGIGNIFLGDDGFGVEVVQQHRQRALPCHWLSPALLLVYSFQKSAATFG